MVALVTFNATVAARTSAARQILHSRELLSLFEYAGGLREDLAAIVHSGERAEALALARSEAQALGGATTAAVLSDFAALQKEYAAVMVIVPAARHTLARAGAAPEVLLALDKILQNDAEVMVRTTQGAGAAEAAGGEAGQTKPKAKRRVPRRSQEAVRAEIARDAAALLHLTGAHHALAQRTVDTKRLKKLQGAAAALSGKLSDRVVDKASAKAATAALHQAVAEQKQHWSACYPLLKSVAKRDARIADLLHNAARPH